MGHDLMCKNCPRPLASECISGGGCDHDSIEEDYISFNHSDNSDIWHVSMSHGHTGRVVSIQLARAIARMTADSVVPGVPPGGDGWTRGPGVFLMHLIRIKTMTDRNPALTFLSDQYWGINPDPDDSNSDGDISDEGDDDEGDDESDEKIPEPVLTGPVTYYRHPRQGQHEGRQLCHRIRGVCSYDHQRGLSSIRMA